MRKGVADLAAALFAADFLSAQSSRAASAGVSYRLKLLRAHGLIARISGTRRHRITRKGSQICAAILLAHHVTVEPLGKIAA